MRATTTGHRPPLFDVAGVTWNVNNTTALVTDLDAARELAHQMTQAGYQLKDHGIQAGRYGWTFIYVDVDGRMDGVDGANNYHVELHFISLHNSRLPLELVYRTQPDAPWQVYAQGPIDTWSPHANIPVDQLTAAMPGVEYQVRPTLRYP